MLILQHNCAGVGQVVEAVCESGIKLGADLILIQEAKRGRDETYHIRDIRSLEKIHDGQEQQSELDQL